MMLEGLKTGNDAIEQQFFQKIIRRKEPNAPEDVQ